MTATDRQRVGLAFAPASSRHAIDLIAAADAAGIDTAWSIMSATGLDSLTLFGAAMERTNAIRLGTAIVPAFTRHPLAMATQALALEGLGPGRLRLGIGTAHARTMVDMFHFNFKRPGSQLREYLEVLVPALHRGEVHFHGSYYDADAKLPSAPGTPVLISALRAPLFELAGEWTEGGISWLCPVDYLLRVAMPALATGAARANRPRPPLIAHVPVVARVERAEARAIARQGLASYAAAPFYARMFADAGYPLGPNNVPSDALLDDLVVSGTADEIAAGLRQRLGRGLDEICASVLAGPDRAADERILIEALTRV